MPNPSFAKTLLITHLAVLITSACAEPPPRDDDDDGAGAKFSVGLAGPGGAGGAGGAGGGHASGGGGVGGNLGVGGTSVDPVYDDVLINFDDLDEGTIITDQYSQYARFSSSGDCACEASSSADVASSKPNNLLTYFTCDAGAVAPIFVDFTKPVQKLGVTFTGVNSDQAVATIRLVFDGGGQHEQIVIGNGDPYIPVVVDLSAAVGAVKRLEIVDVQDFVGLGIDDLKFQFPG